MKGGLSPLKINDDADWARKPGKEIEGNDSPVSLNMKQSFIF